jgi:hypothetical protein
MLNSKNGFILQGVTSDKFKNSIKQDVSRDLPDFIKKNTSFQPCALDELHFSLAIGRISDNFTGNTSKKEADVTKDVVGYLDKTTKNITSMVFNPKNIKVTDGGFIILTFDIINAKDKNTLFNLTKDVLDIFGNHKLNKPKYMQNFNDINQFLPHISIGKIKDLGLDSNGKTIPDTKNIQKMQADCAEWQQNKAKNYSQFLETIKPYALFDVRFSLGTNDLAQYTLQRPDYKVKEIKEWPNKDSISVYFNQKDEPEAKNMILYLKDLQPKGKFNAPLTVEDAKSKQHAGEKVVHISKNDYETTYKHRINKFM